MTIRQPISTDQRAKAPSWKRQSAKAGPFLEDHCGWLLAEHISSPLIFFHQLQLATLTLAGKPLLRRMSCHQSQRCSAFVGANRTLCERCEAWNLKRSLPPPDCPLPPLPQTQLGGGCSRCCAWPGPLLTTVEPDTESHYPKK